MTAITTVLEYAAVREAIQQLTTLDDSGNRRDIVSVTFGETTITYGSNQLQWLQERERELAKRITQRNSRKRVTPDFSAGSDASTDYLNL